MTRNKFDLQGRARPEHDSLTEDWQMCAEGVSAQEQSRGEQKPEMHDKHTKEARDGNNPNAKQRLFRSSSSMGKSALRLTDELALPPPVWTSR